MKTAAAFILAAAAVYLLIHTAPTDEIAGADTTVDSAPGEEVELPPDVLPFAVAEARGEVVLPETWVPGDVRPSVCDPGCCPNLRAVKPALCGSD